MRNDIHMNHMEIYWHDYAKQEGNVPISKASLTEKASVIGRTGLMLLSCGTGAWRVRNSMNKYIIRTAWYHMQCKYWLNVN